MNNQLIEKVIMSNDSSACPELAYENSLIDRNTAAALARSFVKIIRISQQNSNLNNNLRHSVLSNIRKICRIEPENHLEVDENFTNSLAEVYIDKIKDSHKHVSQKSVERSLDGFLLRRMKEVHLDSNYQSSMNPEILQALMNLTENKHSIETLTKDLIHWNDRSKKSLTLYKSLWTCPNVTHSLKHNICDDISIKMRSDIELTILNLCHSVLTDPNLNADLLYCSNSDLKHLLMKCTISAECFQICSSILNHIFIHTNYNKDIQIFISKFIQNIKMISSNSISVLYPVHLCPLIVLVDIDLNVLPSQFKQRYIEQTLVHLKALHDKAEFDLVSVLSHFPSWLDIYYNLSKQDEKI